MTAFTITGARPGSEFRLTERADRLSNATFVAVWDGTIHVTRRLSDLFSMPDEVPVVAHWHGQYRTDGFALTVGELRSLAEEQRQGEGGTPKGHGKS
jgi:hypothetical protein